MNEKLTHFDAAGNAVMVDVTAKPETERTAVAEGWIRVGPEAMRAILEAILNKPARHGFAEPIADRESRGMSQIGG